jgi:hypothetical protein
MTQAVADIAGSWVLKSCYLQRLDNGKRFYHFGENPRGILIMHAGGRMAAVITPRDQPAPVGEAEMANAYGRLVAYSGLYRLEGNRFITDVDVSWLPGWVGSAQGRTFALDGDVLEIVSDPAPSPRGDGAEIRAVLVWSREA